jgi:hypothetical protein
MTRTCTVCNHKDIEEINKLLFCSGSYRDIARQFGLSKDALARHKEGHIPEVLSKSNDIKEIVNADSLLSKLQEEAVFVREMRDSAKEGGDIELALKAVDRALKCIDLYAKVSGLIQEQPTVNITLAAEWIEVRTIMMTALDP